MKLWVKILIAIVCGVTCGIIFGPSAACLKPIGTIFLNLLNMLIVPLVFSSMTLGITNSPDAKKLGRVGLVTLLLYGVTTLIAICLGLATSTWLGLGNDLHFTATQVAQVKQLPSFSELIISIVPRNPIQSFAEGNVLQIILFSILFGTCLNFLGSKAKPITDLLEALSSAMIRMTQIVMAFSPFGVFALMAWATGAFGLEVLLPVMKFLLGYYAACGIFMLTVFCGILFFMAKLSPLPFFKGMAETMATAASTCSSSATLPVNIQSSVEKLGVSKGMANFLLPLGCSLNMNGSAMFQAMSAVFIAQAYGIELHFSHYIILSSTVILATLGTASIPGAGLLMLSIVFASVGIPLEGLAILAGIDRLRDMATTLLNTTGDTVCAVYIAKREGELDEAIYYAKPEIKPIASPVEAV
jgi:dicarboxylate/amino acid:cation (Na+ or H+) symporter, DAACS family